MGDAALGVLATRMTPLERHGEVQDQKDRSGAPATEAHRPRNPSVLQDFLGTALNAITVPKLYAAYREIQAVPEYLGLPTRSCRPRGSGDDEERAAAMKANPNAKKPSRARAVVPYSPHRRVNRSSPCAWDDECV
jgi:hypothetical protein